MQALSHSRDTFFPSTCAYLVPVDAAGEHWLPFLVPGTLFLIIRHRSRARERKAEKGKKEEEKDRKTVTKG